MKKQVLKAGWSAPKVAQAAQAYLNAKHNLLAGFGSVEDFAADETALDPKDKRAIEHHLINLRAALARFLWKKEIYAGVSILDMLVFSAVREGKADCAADVLDELSRVSVSAGFILYPLHSTGIAQQRPFVAPKNSRYVVFDVGGFAVLSQCNDFDVAVNTLGTVMKKLGIRGKVDVMNWRYPMTAGYMAWFTRNPLLLVKIASTTGTYYENQFIYTLKLRLINALLMMLASFNVIGARSGDLNTTRRINNWQTLDIHHYLVGEAFKSGLTRSEMEIDVRRVPMNLSSVELAQLSDVPIDINAAALGDKENQRRLKLLAKTITTVERGFWDYVTLARDKETANARVYRKLVLSLDWYRRSFSATARDSEAVVALAVAFETLLSDFYAKGVTEKLLRG